MKAILLKASSKKEKEVEKKIKSENDANENNHQDMGHLDKLNLSGDKLSNKSKGSQNS